MRLICDLRSLSDGVTLVQLAEIVGKSMRIILSRLTHAHTRAHAPTHAYACTHTHTHTHTHAHTHTHKDMKLCVCRYCYNDNTLQ